MICQNAIAKGRPVARGLGIALMALCTTCWVLSHVLPIRFVVSWPNDFVGVEFEAGRIVFGHASDVGSSGWGFRVWTSGPTWHVFDRIRESLDKWSKQDQISSFHFLGFSYYYPYPREWCHTVPFWFPTSLALVLLWRVWRLRQLKSGRRFPVDPVVAPREGTTPNSG